MTNFGTLLSYEQPTKYIVNDTNYKPTYKTPVLTAGKSFILGYTNETDNIFDDLPVIIFDDFTTESKFVDFPFKVKSSAMKILHINQDLVLPKYAFYLMQATEIDHDNHQRYWISTYSQEIISLPPLSEQIKIIETVENLFDLTQSVETNSQNLKNSIKTTKSKILDLAIRGKLVPQDPNDEPASVLLERIRAEKEELIKQGKIKRDKKESVIFKGDDNSYYEKIGDEITCIDDEIPFEIPDNWCWARLSSFTEVIMGSSPRSQDICRDSNYTEFHQGKIYFSDCLLKESNQYTKKISKIAPKNSVLLCVRAPVGEVNITDREICIGRGLSSIHAYDKIQSNFLFYWLKTQKHVLVNKSTGSTFSAITVDTVKKILLPIPPITEQLRITQKILDLNSNIESIKASLS